MSVAMLGTRMSAWPVICDIEHGVQHGTDLILPNGTTVQTTKKAPDSGSAYAIQHPNSVAAALSSTLLSKGYTSTAYDLVSGESAVFLGDNAWWNDYWFYMADDGVLCGIALVNGVLSYAPMAAFTRNRTKFTKTTIARASSVSADMTTKPPRWIADVQNNGAEAVLIGDSYGGIEYSMGGVAAIYHVKLSGPSTAVVMTEGSKTLSFQRYNLTRPDNWLHTGESIALDFAPGSTDTVKAVIGGTQMFWRDRMASARFKSDGSVEVIHLYSIESTSTSGVYNRVAGYPGSAYEAFVGNAQMTSTIVCELRGGDTVIDSFTISKTSTSTTEWILDGEVLYTSTHSVTTHSGLGLLSDCVVTSSLPKDGAILASAGFMGSDLLGDDTGYAYIAITRPPVKSGQYDPSYYAGVERLTNKVYALTFVGEFDAPVGIGYYPKFAIWAHGVYGINGQKYELDGGLVNYLVPVPTYAEYNAGAFTRRTFQLNATQHPVTFELRYFGSDVDTDDYCFV